MNKSVKKLIFFLIFQPKMNNLHYYLMEEKKERYARIFGYKYRTRTLIPTIDPVGDRHSQLGYIVNPRNWGIKKEQK